MVNGNCDRLKVPDMISENPPFYCRLNQPLFLRVLSRAALSELTVCIKTLASRSVRYGPAGGQWPLRKNTPQTESAVANY